MMGHLNLHSHQKVSKDPRLLCGLQIQNGQEFFLSQFCQSCIALRENSGAKVEKLWQWSCFESGAEIVPQLEAELRTILAPLFSQFVAVSCKLDKNIDSRVKA